MSETSGKADDGVFRLGEWIIDPGQRLIASGDRQRSLEPRVMDLLITLHRAAGQVLSRQRLIDTVWTDTVVNEEALSRAISELRRALGDDSRNPRFIQTIPKTGYRLIPPTPSRSPTAVLEWITAAAVVLTLIAMALRLLGNDDAPGRESNSRTSPIMANSLTRFPGREIDPAIDASGERVVFAWNGPGNGDEYDLYLRRVTSSEPPVKLTHTEGFEGHASWSPDGESVAFVRAAVDGIGLWQVTVSSGVERKLFELTDWSYGLDWFPDGRSLVVSQGGNHYQKRLIRLSLDSTLRQDLTGPDPRLSGDFKPAVSPDGDWVAFVRGDQLGYQDVYVVPAAGGVERAISLAGMRIRGVDWAPDSRRVIYASDIGGGFGLWMVDVTSGEREWLPVLGEDLFNPVVAGTGRLVFESVSFERNLWSYRIDAEQAERLPLNSTRQESDPALSPDGRLLAFVSTRNGGRALWLGNPVTGEARPLSPPGDIVVGTPVWAPDGQRIAISRLIAGTARPCVLAIESGRIMPLPVDAAHRIPVAWSDNRLLLASDRQGRWDLWAWTEESESLERISYQGGITAAIDEAGSLIFTRPGDPTLYQADSGGIHQRARLQGRPIAWRVNGPALLAVGFRESTLAMERLDLSRGTRQALRLPPGMAPGAFSVKGDRLIYSRVEMSASDLMWVDGLF